MIWCAGMPKLPQPDIINLILCVFQELDNFYVDIGLIQLYNNPMRKRRRQEKKHRFSFSPVRGLIKMPN